MDRENGLGKLGCALAALLMIIPSAIWHGWVLSIVWGWFIVPLFGLPSLSIAYAVGLVLVAGMFRGESKTDEDDDVVYRIAKSLGNAFLGPLLVLGLAWIVVQFL